MKDWLPSTMRSEPRTADTRLTGVRIPYDYATAKRISDRGDQDTWDGHMRYLYADALLVHYDRNRLIDEVRD